MPVNSPSLGITRWWSLTAAVVVASVLLSSAAAADDDAVGLLRQYARPLDDGEDLDVLLESIGDARVVMLGESSHGTLEYYNWRAKISRRLIAEKDFDFILIEGDWPASYQVNLYVKHAEDTPTDAREALSNFRRWPQWMWGNEVIKDLIQWMRRHNADLSRRERAGFYGMDVYAMGESMDAVVEYLEAVDPPTAERVKELYEPLFRHRDDPRGYAQSLARGLPDARNQAEQALDILRRRADTYADMGEEESFAAEQNALGVRNAERHYRSLLFGGPFSWNHRVGHMKQTLARLLEHYGPESRAIVWAHNTHIGDARATPKRRRGMRNIGQLARQAYGLEEVFLVGFTTYEGSVSAGRQWQGDRKVMEVPPAVSGSVEYLFEQTGLERMLVPLREPRLARSLDRPLGHRAKGVVYDPADEQGNYVPTVLPRRYDAMIFLSRTEAVEPLAEPDEELPQAAE